MELIVSDELKLLSKNIIETIERENKEYDFKRNKGYIERNVSASKFKNNIMGLRSSDLKKMLSEEN